VAEACCQLGISEQTCYRGKRQVAGMGLAELRRLRQLEEENRKLTHLVADLTLDTPMRQEGLRKKFQSRPSAGSWCHVCGSAFRSARGGRARSYWGSDPPTDTAAWPGIRRPCGCGFETEPQPGCAMGIVAFTSGCSARAGGSTISGSTGWQGCRFA
jgi:putative transposase